jgi:hypothetical protein
VNDSITGFAWGRGGAGEVYVAVSSTGVIGYSRDGDIWEAGKPAPRLGPPGSPDPYDPLDSDSAKRIHFNAVAFGGGAFVAVGNDDRIAWSSDGKSWYAGTTGMFTDTSQNTYSINGIAYGMIGNTGYFVAVGNNVNGSAKIAYSTNGGVTWTFVWVIQFQNIQLRDVVYGDGKFYVVGDGGHTGWSDNPSINHNDANWHDYQYTAMPIQTGTINRIAYGRYGNDPGIAVVYNDGSGVSRKIAVINAADFASLNSWDADLDSGYFGSNIIRGIAYGGGNFVAAGMSSMIGFWPSADKDNDYNRYWRALPFYQFRYWEITALAALNGRFYAGNIGGKIGYSK